MARLPTVGGDNGNWGQILNDYLSVEHNADGTLKKAADIAAAKAAADSAVQSVNGETGQAITLTASDVSAVPTTQLNAPTTDRQVARWDQTNTRLSWKDPLVFDVRDFGAIPNDDSVALANTTAITNAMTAASAAGGVIQFYGVYTIHNAVAVRDNVTLEGMGSKGGVKIAAGRNVDAVVNFDTTNGNSNIAIRNLYIDGNKANRAGLQGNGIRFLASDGSPCERVVIENCVIAGSQFAGIMLQNVNKFQIIGNRVEDTERDGITVWFNSADGVISNNVVLEAGDDCIALNSEFDGHIGAKCQRITIADNTVRQRYDGVGHGGGIHLLGAEEVTITGNVIGQSMGWGIFVVNGYNSGAAQPSQRVTIIGNTVKDSRDSGGIAVGSNSVAVSVVGNVVKGYAGQGIQCYAPAVVSGNYLLAGTSTTSHGVYIDTAAQGTVVTGNRFEGCAATGITIAASRCTVSGNTFKDSGSLTAGQANCLIATGINRCSVTGNIFHLTTTGTYGVRIASGAGGRNVVTGNIAEGFGAGNSFSDGSTSGTNIMRNNSPSDQPLTIASAATVRLDGGAPLYKISGTTNIDTITATGRDGDVVTLIFTGALTVNDGTGNLRLASNFATAANSTLQLSCDGTNWFEIARSTN